MEKIRNIEQLKNTVAENEAFFRQYYYHSLIDSNLAKLEQILRYGLLSKALIERKNLINLYTHQKDDFDSKNGQSYVSLTAFNSKKDLSLMFDSFAFHTLCSISVMINKDIEVSKQGERETFFEDEVFAKDSIDKSKIEGIILPYYLTEQRIKELCCLPNDLSCYTKRYITNWIKTMENYFSTKIKPERIFKSLDQFWDIAEEYERPENWTSSIAKTQQHQYGTDIKDVLAEVLEYLWMNKMKKSDPTCLDVLKYINEDKLPIYEIGERTLTKKL